MDVCAAVAEGHTTVKDIAAVTGLSTKATKRALHALWVEAKVTKEVFPKAPTKHRIARTPKQARRDSNGPAVPATNEEAATQLRAHSKTMPAIFIVAEAETATRIDIPSGVHHVEDRPSPEVAYYIGNFNLRAPLSDGHTLLVGEPQPGDASFTLDGIEQSGCAIIVGPDIDGFDTAVTWSLDEALKKITWRD